VVFARSYYRGPLLGVVLAVARECEPPSFDVCLPCDACISGGFSGCFSGFFWLVLVFFGPGAARAPSLTLNITIPLVLRYARPDKRYRTKEI
jgi:hypothetical protein